MTPPRTDGFGPLSWLWWPVLFLLWAVAADKLAAEWLLARLGQPVVFVGQVVWHGGVFDARLHSDWWPVRPRSRP